MFRRFVDETEIDEWFEEEKTRLQKKYFSSHYAGKGGKDLFEKEMKKLFVRYEKEHQRFVNKESRKQRVQQPVIFLKNFFAQKKKRVRERVEQLKKRYEEWRFEREYEKLMKK